jgi:hypothetical protein
VEEILLVAAATLRFSYPPLGKDVDYHANYGQKTFQFIASCNDSIILQETYTFETAKSFSRCRRVRS